MRFGVLAAVLAVSSSARAGWLELSGFAGVDSLPKTVKLGNNTDYPEQRPQTGPEFGVRAGWIAVPLSHFELGVEAEVTMTASWTGYGFEGSRASDFAPVFGYRGNLVLRYADEPRIKPYVLVGAGGASVLTSSRYLADTSDPQLYYGIGATIALGGDFDLRVDARQGWLPTESGEGATYELLLGVATSFGRPPPPPPPVIEEQLPPALVAKALPTGDDAPEEATPATPMPIPTPTPTPTPTPDPDHDGITTNDACPNDAETLNGFEDEDGCPDAVPAAIVNALDGARAVKFEPKRVRLTDAATTALAPALEVLRTHPRLHVDVIAHAAAGDHDADLAKKRADAVKWHFVEEGVPEDQLAIVVGRPAGTDDPPIELTLHVGR
ncbi:MAG TPA: outer membrane beta-barrel protein [Kofleriaceae bacterium]